MFGIIWRNVEVYKVIIKLLVMEGFVFEVESINVEKDVLRFVNLLIKFECCYFEEIVWLFEKIYFWSCGLLEDMYCRVIDIRSEFR